MSPLRVAGRVSEIFHFSFGGRLAEVVGELAPKEGREKDGRAPDVGVGVREVLTF